MKRIVLFGVMLALVIITGACAATVPAAPVSAGEIPLFDGPWVGKWVSSKGDTAPMKALVQADVSTGVVTFIMFQTPDPPAPSYSSLSMGKLEGDKVIIDAASSGIGTAGDGTEMTFWLESPLIMKGTYKNKYDEGRFEFKRTSGKSL